MENSVYFFSMRLLVAVFVLGLVALSYGNVEQPHVNLMSTEKIMEHLEVFQAIADANNGNRAAQYSGYNASVDYVVGILSSQTNYTVTVQPFNFDITDEVSAPKFAQISPSQVTYSRYVDFATMSYTGSGDVQALATFGR